GTTPPGQLQPPAVMLPHGGEGLCVRRMTVWWTCRRPFMGRPVPRELLRNAVLDVTTIGPTTAYHRRSYTERYSRFIHRAVQIALLALHLDVCLIHPPADPHRALAPMEGLLELRAIFDDPPVHGGVIHVHPPFFHEFFDMAR